MFERILIPLDGSVIAKQAIPVAAHLPARAVQLLRVEPLSPDRGLLAGSNFDPGVNEKRAVQIRAELDALGKQFRERGATLEATAVFDNDPAETIIAAAANAELVVMTTRSRSPVARALLGSIATRVLRESRTPILLVRAGRRPVAPVEPARIFVPLDGSALAELALPVATKLALSMRLPLLLVRAVDPDIEEIWHGEARPGHFTQEAAEYLATQVEPLTAAGCLAEYKTVTGNPEMGLLRLIRKGDIVVMTSHGWGGVLRQLLGSVAEHLVRRAPAPVLIVPAAGGGSTRDAHAGGQTTTTR